MCLFCSFPNPPQFVPSLKRNRLVTPLGTGMSTSASRKGSPACSSITHLHPHREFICLLFLEGFHGLCHSPKAHRDIQLTLIMVRWQFISSFSLILGMSFWKWIPFHVPNTWYKNRKTLKWFLTARTNDNGDYMDADKCHQANTGHGGWGKDNEGTGMLPLTCLERQQCL